MDNRGVEALLRRSAIPLDERVRRAARTAARSGVDIRPILALAAVHAVRAGRRIVTLEDFDAAVVGTAWARLHEPPESL